MSDIDDVLAEEWEADGFLVHIKGEAMRDICECFNNVDEGQEDWRHCNARARAIVAGKAALSKIEALLEAADQREHLIPYEVGCAIDDLGTILAALRDGDE